MMTGSRKAPWRPLPESAVPLSRQHMVREAVARGAEVLGIPVPAVVIAPTKSVGNTHTDSPESIRMDSYLAAHAPGEVLVAMIAHEVGHLAPNRPSDRGTRRLGLAARILTLLMAAGMVWVGATMGRAFVHHPGLLGFYLVVGLPAALLIASYRMVRPLERAADAVAVDLVGSDAFVAARHWVATHYHPWRQEGRLLDRMKAAIDTHPTDDDRIAAARALNRPPGPLLKVLTESEIGEERTWDVPS